MKAAKWVTRYKSTGTQQGIFNGLDPTGKKITIYETSIYRIVNGTAGEQWGFPDALSLNNQLEAKKGMRHWVASWADGILFPNLHKAQPVMRNAWTTTELHTTCKK